MECELCQRDVNHLTVHHLIPKQKNGHKGPIANICSACHHQIHALFENTLLAQKLNSLEKLKQEPEMQKFLKWASKQKPDKRIPVRRPNK